MPCGHSLVPSVESRRFSTRAFRRPPQQSCLHGGKSSLVVVFLSIVAHGLVEKKARSGPRSTVGRLNRGGSPLRFRSGTQVRVLDRLVAATGRALSPGPSSSTVSSIRPQPRPNANAHRPPRHGHPHHGSSPKQVLRETRVVRAEGTERPTRIVGVQGGGGRLPHADVGLDAVVSAWTLDHEG